MTETTGVVSINYPGNVKIGSVGQIIPDTEVRIAEDGEICVRAPQNISGYYKNDEATKELLKSDGNGGFWLHTGDVGNIDEDGYLFITDRKKDILITAGGKNVAPQNIENLLKTSPYVSQAMVYGDRKPYLTALVTLDEDEITKFARDNKLLFQDMVDLSRKEEVVDLISEEIRLKNEDLASYESVKKFRILEEDFDQDKDEITPTFKIRRKVIVERYGDLLEGMYSGS
jgi:long-chain acyl-CoA synthetase